MRYVTALFDAPIPARAAIAALRDAGFSPRDMTVLPPLPRDDAMGAESVIAPLTDDLTLHPDDVAPPPDELAPPPNDLALPADDPRRLADALAALGVAPFDAACYAEGVRRGAILLVVATPTLSAPLAAAAIDSVLPPDLDDLAEAWAVDPELHYRWRDMV